MSDLLSRLSLQPVDSGDFEDMLALRIDAMRPSLERLGRFDLTRSRERMNAGFIVPFMHHIVIDGEQRVGFVTLKPEGPCALRLDHLYLRTGFQGRGIGEWIMRWAKAQARNAQRDILLTALVKSDANRFYLRHGFVLEGGEGVDLHYRWPVAAEATC